MNDKIPTVWSVMQASPKEAAARVPCRRRCRPADAREPHEPRVRHRGFRLVEALDLGADRVELLRVYPEALAALAEIENDRRVDVEVDLRHRRAVVRAADGAVFVGVLERVAVDRGVLEVAGRRLDEAVERAMLEVHPAARRAGRDRRLAERLHLQRAGIAGTVHRRSVCHAARFTGSFSTIDVPTPSIDATEISPPCASTICLSMSRPRPVPPPPRSDFAPLCLSFSQICASSFDFIPTPLSVTVDRKRTRLNSSH